MSRVPNIMRMPIRTDRSAARCEDDGGTQAARESEWYLFPTAVATQWLAAVPALRSHRPLAVALWTKRELSQEWDLVHYVGRA